MAVGYNPNIVSDGLVYFIDPANLRSYSGSGVTANGLIGGLGGALVNGVGFATTNNGYFIFDGTDDYIDFGSSSSLKLTDNFTLSAWVKSDVYGDRAILGNFGPSSNYSGFNFNIQPSNKFAFLTGSHPSYAYLYADNTFSLNIWYYITGLRRSGTNYLYINGIVQTGTNTQVVATSAQNFYFGKWYSDLTDFYHSGQISQVKLYNRALSQQEILQNFNATRFRYGI